MSRSYDPRPSSRHPFLYSPLPYHWLKKGDAHSGDGILAGTVVVSDQRAVQSSVRKTIVSINKRMLIFACPHSGVDTADAVGGRWRLTLSRGVSLRSARSKLETIA